MGIVGLILLVTCVNLANLMLARAATRSQEMSIRVALGANRWVLARQVLTESLTVSFTGALLGLTFAYWGSRLLVALMTQEYLTPVRHGVVRVKTRLLYSSRMREAWLAESAG